jgi:hypothetical protein
MKREEGQGNISIKCPGDDTHVKCLTNNSVSQTHSVSINKEILNRGRTRSWSLRCWRDGQRRKISSKVVTEKASRYVEKPSLCFHFIYCG